MLCPKCGSYVEDGKRSCPVCGADVTQGAGGPDQSGYTQGNYTQSGYTQGAYNQTQTQGGYTQGSYNQTQTQSGYTQGAYPQQGYQPGGYQQQGWQQPGTPPQGWQGQPVRPAAPELSMKWYKFLINFALWAAGVLNVITALMYITGGIYVTQGVEPDLVYDVFPGMKPVDVIYGLVILALAAFVVYTRFQLAGFKQRGPLFLYIIYGLNAATGILYTLISAAATGVSGVASGLFTTAIAPAVYLALNYVYFNKRKHLFIN